MRGEYAVQELKIRIHFGFWRVYGAKAWDVTSAGNLFKFCRRAITEYQVAVSD